jgi:hypothetical protein
MLMETALEKDELLHSAGFRYHFGGMAYVNTKAKKVVSVEAVEGHSEDWLRQLIAQVNDSDDWLFYFDQPLSAAVKQAFLAKFG